MANRTFRPWTVTPHDPPVEHEPNLWTVSGPVPGNPRLNRRMAIVRLEDGRLVFFNAVPLDAPTLERVRAWGTPSILIVPEHSHAMHAHAFKERLGLKAYCPAADRAEVEKRTPVDGTVEELALGPTVRFEAVQGDKYGETVMEVRHGERASLVFCDVLMQLAAKDFPWLVRLLGFTGGVKVIPLWRWRVMKDKAAVKAHLHRLAKTPGLCRLVFSHGANVEQGAAEAVTRAAERL